MPTTEARDADVQESLNGLSIGILHLGTKTRLLEEAGYRSIGDVRDVDPAVLMRIPSVGRQTAEELVRNRVALRDAVDGNGVIDWQGYCASAGIPLLPLRPPHDGHELLAGLPDVLGTLAQELDDDVLATILLDRISRPPGSQKTLEEIGAAARPRLTRERVRQKERKLLRQITGGLLNDSYDGLGIHFHPGFARWWQSAADALVGVEEIEVGRFVEVLASVWRVSGAAVMEQLPALVAVVTGEPQMAARFRALTKIDPRLFGEESLELVGLPVLKLRIAKDAVRLVEAGMPLVGDVLDSLRSGGLERIGVSAARRVTDHLNLVASCTSEMGVDWAGYRAAVGLSGLPSPPPAVVSDFVSTLPQAVERLLKSHTVSIRAAEIFRHRTGRDATARMTLHQVGETLGTFPSTIKREETVFLAWLNDVLVSREFWRLEVWLDGSWLAWWAEAQQIFALSADDYERFEDNLAWRWRLTKKEIKTAAPTLWAVFTGYPDGRRSVYQTVVPKIEEGSAAGRIRLKGFRRLH